MRRLGVLLSDWLISTCSRSHMLNVLFYKLSHFKVTFLCVQVSYIISVDGSDRVVHLERNE